MLPSMRLARRSRSGPGQEAGTVAVAAAVAVTNGRPRDAVEAAPGGVHGLIGLGERVRLSGGTLHAAPRDGGFQVVARVPAADVSVAADPREQEPVSARQFAAVRRATHSGLVSAVVVLAGFTAAVMALPAGARCEYYRVTDDLFSGLIDTYRLCFTGDRLAGKDFSTGTAR